MKYIKVIALFIVVYWLSGCRHNINNKDFYSVFAVLDGDTIILENAKNVRYIGIDTPELREKVADRWVYKPRPYAQEAFNLNKRLAEGKRVRLEFDRERTDRYGRWLAYVFIDSKMINEELLRAGYAVIYTRHPNIKYHSILTAAEKDAKINKRGLWSLKKGDGR